MGQNYFALAKSSHDSSLIAVQLYNLDQVFRVDLPALQAFRYHTRSSFYRGHTKLANLQDSLDQRREMVEYAAGSANS